ncbi:MAG: hypothetical protein WC285_04675 [Candidatus Gracilibacteria bacterium]|jgi:hypothetical protein
MGEVLGNTEVPKRLSETDFLNIIKNADIDIEHVEKFDNCIDLLYRDYADESWRKGVLEAAIDKNPPLAFRKFDLYRHEAWAEEVIKKASEENEYLFASYYDLVQGFSWAEPLAKKCVDGNPEVAIQGYSKFKKCGLKWADEGFIRAARLHPISVLENKDKFPDIFANSQDPLFQKLREIDKSGVDIKVCFFIDPLMKGEMSIEEASNLLKDRDRMVEKLFEINFQDSPYYGEALVHDVLGEVASERVISINSLHTEKDSIRFASVAGKNSFQLYLTIGFGASTVHYTSTFLGLYQRLIAQLSKEKNLHFHYCKRIISRGLLV